MAWLGTWAKRRKITIDNTNIDSNLTHFAVPIVLGTSVGQSAQDVSDIFDEVGSSSLKIAITKSDGTTEIYGEIEHWDNTGEKAVIWVSKSDLVLSSSGTTDLYLYFDSGHADNTTHISTSGGTPAQNVWDSDFAAVYHMAQDPTGGAGAVKDSTSNNNDGTSAGSMTSGDLIDGLIGKALDIDGTDDYIDTGDATSMDGATAATFEFAGKFPSFINSGSIIRKWAAGQQSFIFALDDATPYNDIMMLINDSGQTNPLRRHTTTAALTVDTDYVLAMTWGGTNTGAAYKDGAILSTYLQGDFSPSSIPNTSERLGLGARYNAGAPDLFCNMQAREIRISSTERSAAWLKATSHSLKDDLIVFSAAENFLTLPTAEMIMSASFVLQIGVSIPTAEMTMSASQMDPAVLFTAQMVPAEMTMSASQMDPAIQFTAQMSAAEMTMSAKVGVVETVEMSAAEMTMSASLVLQIGVSIPTAEMAMVASLGDVLVFDHTRADVYYIFTLTGAADSLEDLEIPMSSFQTRMRSGDPTFLSVVIPDGDYAAAITARSNGTLKVDMAYKLDGVFIQRETIVQADFESVRVDEGPTSSPITLSGHKTEIFPGAALTLGTSTYRSTIDGKIRHRLAEPNINLRPGDTVTIGSDTFVVDLITYFISVKSKTMEISEA